MTARSRYNLAFAAWMREDTDENYRAVILAHLAWQRTPWECWGKKEEG